MRRTLSFFALSLLYGTAAIRSLQAQVFGVDAINSEQTQQTFVPGVIRAEVYLGIGGNAVGDLTGNPKYPDKPDEIRFLKFMEFPSGSDSGSPPPADVNNNYGVKISGFVIPKQTASYVFFIASDDNGELWLSTDDSVANKRLIAREPEWNPVRTWTVPTRRPGCPENGGARCDNRSQPIRLEANKRYYIEAFFKEGLGGDNLAVTWIKQGEPDPTAETLPIGSEFLGAFVDTRATQPPVIIVHPQDQSADPGARASFTVQAIGTPPLRYQWRLNGVNLPGENGSTLSRNNVQPTTSGLYSVAIQNAFGAVSSRQAGLSVRAPVLTLADAFERRVNTSAPSFSGRSSNQGFTRQSGEPFHANKNGSTSAWIAWTASTNGIATFTSEGSAFDTLLAVYTGTVLSSLTRVTSDDDSGGALTSKVSFNARAGIQYQIAIDGFNGASGDLVLTWGLTRFGETLPVVSEIEKAPASPSVVPGTRVRLSVQGLEVPTGARTSFQWYLNGKEIQGATTNELVIPSVQRQDVGGYVARLTTTRTVPTIASVGFTEIRNEVFSVPALIQINTAGETNVAALDKLGDWIVSSNRTSRLSTLSAARQVGPAFNTLGGAAAAPARGFSGSQVFNSSCVNPGTPPCSPANKETNEPNHGGEIGGASMWMSYQPLVDGVLTIDSSDSDFRNVVAVYTGVGSLVTGLTEVTYLEPTKTMGNGKLVKLQAVKDQIYHIAVDGVGGATGLVTLKYDLASSGTSVTLVTTDTSTQGNWKGVYGTDGHYLIGDSIRLPGYAGVTPSGHLPYTWTSSTSETPALQKESLSDRLAACWYAPAVFNIDLSLTDSLTHRVALYFLDWQNTDPATMRQQRVDILDATGATVLDTRIVSGFNGGKYLVWNIRGPVRVRITNTGPLNAVLSGLFFGSPSSLGTLSIGSPKHVVAASNRQLFINSFERLTLVGQFRLNAVVEPRREYLIEASTNLIHWAPLTTNLAPASGILEFVDADAASLSHRFYRILQKP